MMSSLSRSISRILRIKAGNYFSPVFFTTIFIALFIALVLTPGKASGRIILNINEPSAQTIKIAIPDFRNKSEKSEHPKLSTGLPEVLGNDLELSGYFTSMEKGTFLEEENRGFGSEQIRFKDWSVIGAELLLKAEYTTIGRNLEIEARLYDVYQGRRLFARRFLGKVKNYRALMHRLGNEIIYLLSGRKGMFLTKLLFVGTATGSKEIYLSDYDGHNVKKLTSDRNITLFPKWSPKGDRFSYISYRDGGPMLYLKDFASGKTKRISSRKGLNIGACWAPDSKSLALTLSHKNSPDIYIIDLNGKIIKRLIDHWAIDVSPTFSPDGKKIAFVSNRSGSPQIYIKDLIEGKEERLSFEGKYNTSPAWSRHDKIAFTGMNNGNLDIFTIDPDGSNLRQLTENQRNNEDPSWSSDGRYVAFSSNRTGAYRLYIMNEYGQNHRQITNLKGEQTAPSWSPF